MWSLSKVHQIGELTAAIAVVISLIFVGLEIRDNTVATRAATYQDTVAYDIGNLQTFGASPETATVFYTFVDDPNSLEGGEFLQGRTLFTASIRHMENLYFQHEIGMLSDEAWATREPLVRRFVLSPGFEIMMSGGNERTFGGSFIDYAKRIRAESSSGPN